jgi:hypothetical protein
MKKIYLLLTVAALMFLNASAQLEKEHAFDDQASINMQLIRLENEGQKFCLVNREDSIFYQYVFYNLDYSEFATISVNLGPLFIISDYHSPSLYISFIAENVFDLDNDIDMMGQLVYYDNDQAEYAQVLVFHQDGSVLFKSDVDNTNAWLFSSTAINSGIISSLTNSDAGAKMILDVYYFNEGAYSYDVYALPGNFPASVTRLFQTDGETGNYLYAYPVPARNAVFMEYQLHDGQTTGTIEISNEGGQLIQKIRVSGGRGGINIPVTDYKNGIYLYKLNTKRGVPRYGKMLIIN